MLWKLCNIRKKHNKLQSADFEEFIYEGTFPNWYMINQLFRLSGRHYILEFKQFSMLCCLNLIT